MISSDDQPTPPPDALCESWESIEQKTVELGRAIAADCQKTGERFDVLMVVPRGSYYPANIVSRMLGFGATDLLHACIGSYAEGATERSKEQITGQMPSPQAVKGKDILIIEEVCETGHTLQFLADWLKQAGAGRVRVGVLHYKPSRSQTGFKPDWFVTQTDRWVVYPWEAYESLGEEAVVYRRSGS